MKIVRDHRIDFLRGLALASIFVNHMQGNWLGNWTSRNFGFSDAAEVFVLLAGFAAAMAFFPSFSNGNLRGVLVKVGRRAGVLYAVHLAATLTAVVLFWGFALWADNIDALDLIGVAPLLADPWPGIRGILIGGFQLGYFNILPLYVALLLMLPMMLWLAARDLRLLAAASIATYLAANVGGLTLPNYPSDGSWFFNPFAWQILFALGLGLGVMRLRARSVPYNSYVMTLAIIYLIASAAWLIGNFGGVVAAELLPEWVGTLQKSNVPATRLVHVMALAYVLCHSPLWSLMSRIPSTIAITRMGRNSLPVFAVGSVLSMIGWIILIQTSGGILIDAVVASVGLAIMIGVAYQRDLGKRPVRLPAAAIPASRETTVTLRR